jgi:hypothetical protein
VSDNDFGATNELGSSPAPQRLTLPTRRYNETVMAEWDGHPFTLTMGYDRPGGTVFEVFADTAKGGQMQGVLADACVLISIALQHGITPAALAKSIARCPNLLRGDGAELPASPIGTILDMIGTAA